MKLARPLFVAFSLAAAAIGSAHADTFTLTAIADSTVQVGQPYAYSGNVLSSEYGTSGPGTVWLSLIKFDLHALAGFSVSSAELQLTTLENHNSASFLHQVYSSADDSWTESTINGQNLPSAAQLSLLSSTAIDGTSKTYSWNVLAGVNGPDGKDGTLTLLLKPDLTQVGVFGPHIADRTAATGFPQLVVQAAPVPEPETWAMLLGGLVVTALRRPKKQTV